MSEPAITEILGVMVDTVIQEISMERKLHLQVKIKTLAAEARIIRQLERRKKSHARRARGWREGEGRPKDKVPDVAVAWSNAHLYTRQGLYLHRILDVRREARASLLAYGFLRGRPYKVMEEKCYEKPKWDRVCDIAVRFSSEDRRTITQRFEEWRAS